MTKQERMIQKIKAEPDPTLRLMKMVIFISENGSAEQKDGLEKFLRERVLSPERAEA